MAEAAPGTGGSSRQEVALDRSGLQALQLGKLRALLEEILPRNRFYARKLQAGPGGGAAARLSGIEGLARFPFTTKAELQADQEANPPFGTNLTYPLDSYTRFHQTSGSRGRPIRWLDTPRSWENLLDCWKTIYSAAGVSSSDRLFFPFSFGPFLGFWAAFEGAARRGSMVLPGGGLSSAARVRFLMENGATVLLSTPTYALRLAEVARQEGIDLARGAVRTIIVAGEPGGSIPAVRERIESAWGARCFDHWGMTEVGPLGFEPAGAPGEISLIETACIPEVIDPETGAPVAPGVRGELCITTLHRAGSPLIRYRTGDLVTYSAGRAPSGPDYLRLPGGILGRLDDMILVKGNNIYPAAIEAVLCRIPGIAEYRVEVYRREGAAARVRMVIEPAEGAEGSALTEEVARAILDSLYFRPEVALAAPGDLPRFEMKSDRIQYREETVP